MKLRVCVALFSLAATTLYAADKPKPKPAPPAPSAQEKAAMEAMTKAATPGAEHKKLSTFAGTWDTTVTSWMAPGTPPAVSKGTSKNSMILGGRYLEQQFSGTFMGAPFYGVGHTGYDNVKKQYVGTWMDNFGTGVMETTGHADGDQAWKFSGTVPDPMTGKDSPVEEKLTIVDKDHHTLEMWSPGPDGKMFKMMEIKYARKK
jgi:hypothetical protein